MRHGGLQTRSRFSASKLSCSFSLRNMKEMMMKRYFLVAPSCSEGEVIMEWFLLSDQGCIVGERSAWRRVEAFSAYFCEWLWSTLMERVTSSSEIAEIR